MSSNDKEMFQISIPTFLTDRDEPDPYLDTLKTISSINSKESYTNMTDEVDIPCTSIQQSSLPMFVGPSRPSGPNAKKC